MAKVHGLPCQLGGRAGQREVLDADLGHLSPSPSGDGDPVVTVVRNNTSAPPLVFSGVLGHRVHDAGHARFMVARLRAHAVYAVRAASVRQGDAEAVQRIAERTSGYRFRAHQSHVSIQFPILFEMEFSDERFTRLKLSNYGLLFNFFKP